MGASGTSLKAAPRAVKLKDHTILGLDIGSRFIKIAEMSLSRGIISLLNVAVCPTPPGLVNNSAILDPVGLGKAIRQLLATSKIKCRKVVVAISGQSSVVVRPIDLPRMTRKELADTMKFEVERHIPFAVDEVVMDYAPLVEPELLPETEANMKVLLAVAQEELIHSYIKTLGVAGLKPVAMDVEILATIRALIDNVQDSGMAERTVALVNIGSDSTDISIVNRGQLAFTRSVPIAGDELTKAIADQLGRNIEEAEELKKAYGKVFVESSLDEFAAPAAPGEEKKPYFDGGGGDEQAGTTQASADLFSLDDGFDIPGPLFLGDEGEDVSAQGAAPAAFVLDEEVEDVAPAADTPSAPAPVFDLSSELEEQMPAPIARPAPKDEPVEGMFAGPVSSMAMNAPDAEPVADATAGPAAEPQPDPMAVAPMAVGAEKPAFEPEGGSEIFQRRIFDAMLPTLIELVTEVRRSLEYYAGREPETPIEWIILYGGTSRLPGLTEFIQQEIGVDVYLADPLKSLNRSQFRQPAEYLQDLAPALPVVIGLGLRDMLA